jgi:hypothetical protein
MVKVMAESESRETGLLVPINLTLNKEVLVEEVTVVKVVEELESRETGLLVPINITLNKEVLVEEVTFNKLAVEPPALWRGVEALGTALPVLLLPDGRTVTSCVPAEYAVIK